MMLHKALIIAEDNPYTFTGADFGFDDPVESHNFAALTINTVTTSGLLTLKGMPVNDGELVTITDINSGSLVYTPAQQQNGASIDILEFSVHDNGGTDNDGIDNDLQPNTLSDFGFTDLEDNNDLLAVIVESIPAEGDLTLNGASVFDGQPISVEQIAAGQLIYVAPPTDSFTQSNLTFRVVDNGGTANGGQNTAIRSPSTKIPVISFRPQTLHLKIRPTDIASPPY